MNEEIARSSLPIFVIDREGVVRYVDGTAQRGARYRRDRGGAELNAMNMDRILCEERAFIGSPDIVRRLIES